MDAALARAEAGLVAAPLDLGMLQRYAEQAPVPALLRTLVRPGLRRAGAASIAASALRRRLTVLPEKERLGALVALVQEVVAAVLGLAGAAAVPANQPLKELGLDSLMAVELRNRLSARAETTLPTTLVFDYPTPEAIAQLLLRQAFAELDAAGHGPVAPRGGERRADRDRGDVVPDAWRGGRRGGLLGAVGGRSGCHRAVPGALG